MLASVPSVSRTAWRTSTTCLCRQQQPQHDRRFSRFHSSHSRAGSNSTSAPQVSSSRILQKVAAGPLSHAPPWPALHRLQKAPHGRPQFSSVRSYATEAPPSDEPRAKKQRPPPPLPKSAWSESTISGPASGRSPASSKPGSKEEHPYEDCCTECSELPKARRERDAQAERSRQMRDSDSRPFYKKYPPPAKAPEAITFDQPAIPNPGQTAEAHQRFRKYAKIGGTVLAVLSIVAAGLYMTGTFDKIHLESEDPLLLAAPKGSRVTVQGGWPPAVGQITQGDDDGSLIQDKDISTHPGQLKGIPMSREEMEEEIRKATKKQAAQGSYALLTVKRSSTIAKAVFQCMWDYRQTFNKKYASKEEEREGLRQCHLRSAHRVLKALQKNGGVYIKLGQHASAVMLLPIEWTETLKPLQDQNTPTPLPELEAMFRQETGMSFAEAFSEIDPKPIGVASLAQVHRARDKETGMPLAIKMMHPDVERFCEVDMKTVTNLTALVKRVFPEFEFTWLAEEIDANLPLEMDFRHEAANSRKAAEDFARYRKTAVYIPTVPWVFKRVMAMEYIDGKRPDDLRYLAAHHIDRNRVSQELSRCFAQMLYMHGFFHADPHGGNVLIRPAPKGSRSPYNFEVVLLDHGLYFDIDKELRANYGRFWLSLISRSSPVVQKRRRHYAKLIANIDEDLYPILESAITGRSGLEGSDAKNPHGVKGRKRASSILDSDTGANMSDDEVEHIRKTVMEKEGLFTSILDLLRRVPRRMLMVLKLNDLTRSLDASLHTTHGPIRPFIISARYCALAAWEDDKDRLKEERHKQGWSVRWLREYISCWYQYIYFYRGFAIIEAVSDLKARISSIGSYGKHLIAGGSDKAAEAASGVTAQEVQKAKQAGVRSKIEEELKKEEGR